MPLSAPPSDIQESPIMSTSLPLPLPRSARGGVVLASPLLASLAAAESPGFPIAPPLASLAASCPPPTTIVPVSAPGPTDASVPVGGRPASTGVKPVVPPPGAPAPLLPASAGLKVTPRGSSSSSQPDTSGLALASDAQTSRSDTRLRAAGVDLIKLCMAVPVWSVVGGAPRRGSFL
jgi:hypothetical protein